MYSILLTLGVMIILIDKLYFMSIRDSFILPMVIMNDEVLHLIKQKPRYLITEFRVLYDYNINKKSFFDISDN